MESLRLARIATVVELQGVGITTAVKQQRASSRTVRFAILVMRTAALEAVNSPRTVLFAELVRELAILRRHVVVQQLLAQLMPQHRMAHLAVPVVTVYPAPRVNVPPVIFSAKP